jgi:hypothetical protein
MRAAKFGLYRDHQLEIDTHFLEQISSASAPAVQCGEQGVATAKLLKVIVLRHTYYRLAAACKVS